MSTETNRNPSDLAIGQQQKLKIGLVGCGRHGFALAQAIARCESLDLVACADPDEIAVNRSASISPDVSTHVSVETMLAECDVDAVVVATPHHLLAPIALEAIRAQKHVMVEKPIALNDREAEEIEIAVEQTGICYMAGYSFRFSMGRHVRELIDMGVIGDMLAINSSICTGSLNDRWIAYPETGGGPLLYVGCHLIDWILWFADAKPASVFAMMDTRKDTGADSRSAFQLRLTNQVLAQCFVLQSASTFSFQIDIHGTAGKISLRGYNFLQFDIEVISKAVEIYNKPTMIRPAIQRDNIEMMLIPELEEFASAIRDQRPPSITLADGRQVLRVMDAIRKSSQSGEMVQVPPQ